MLSRKTGTNTNGHMLQMMAQRALSEIGAVLQSVADDVAESLCTEILQARRIACYGAGREGLMIKAFCMRLMHLGLNAHMAGDMTAPFVGTGDLLLVSAGPGSFSTVMALLGVAHEAGARTLVVTAQAAGLAARIADTVIHLPAQTMTDDLVVSACLLPMGSLYEAVQLLFFDLISILLRLKLGQTPEQMRVRHTNLE